MLNREQRRALDQAILNAKRQLANLTPEPAVDSAANATTTTPAAEPPEKEISDAQLKANQANAAHSTGPTSAAGRKKISLNALKTGLTGAQVLLPTDDADRYATHVRDYQNEFQPVGPEETHLLQSIIDCRWRITRIPGLESALLELARRSLINQEPGLANNPPPLLEMQARLHLDRDLRNLYLQENRLVRRREREMKEFRELQAVRKTAEQAKAKQAQPVKTTEPTAAAAAPQAANGFVFTPPNLDDFLAILTPETRAQFLKEMAESGVAAGENQQAAA
jgi:hypothetical protein